MATITYKHSDGTQTLVEAVAPDTVMRAAKSNDVPGILAQCGGSAQCGTCHVYVDVANTLPLPPVDPVEDDVLWGTCCPRRESSRLSCQLPVSEEIDGLVVHTPEAQQ